MPPKLFDAFAPVASLTDNFHIWLTADKRCYAVAEQRMIVDDENTYRTRLQGRNRVLA
jgi:hypothetical protein